MFRPTSVVASLLATAALAQGPSTLIGVTAVAGDLRQQSHSACAVLGSCAPAGFPGIAGLPSNSGGTGWDAARSAAWISNGQFIAAVENGCAYACPPIPVPGLFAGQFVAGLEVVNSLDQLWAVDTGNNLRFFNLGRPPVPAGTCAIAFGPGAQTTGGLAVDELAGLVFYARYDAVMGQNFIAFAPIAAPCNVLGGVPVPNCAGGSLSQITGLAVDAVAQVIYVAAGSRSVALAYVTPAAGGIAITGSNCCGLPVAGDALVGLALRPGQPTTTGASCTGGGCGFCPTVHTLRGDPVLGNAQFGLRLENAPTGFAWCAVGAGPCVPGGVVIPGFCGPMHTLPLLGLLGGNAMPAAGCGGSTVFPVALPLNPALGGLVLSSQCFGLCAVGGTFISSCLSWELQAQ